MIAQRLWIPGQLPGLNELLKAKRRERGNGQDAYGLLKRAWQERIAGHARAQQIVPALYPVRLAFVWHEGNARRDPDNICAGGTKVLLDALVLSRILPDDSQQWVRGLEHTWLVDRCNPGVLVTIAEVPSASHAARQGASGAIAAAHGRPDLPPGAERILGPHARIAKVW